MRPFLIAAAAARTIQAPAGAQTAATRRAREVVAIINSSTPKLLKAYVDSAFGGPMRDRSPDDYVNLLFGLREGSGGLEWVSLQEESASRAIVLMRRRLTGETNALQVEIEADSPNRITRLDLRPPPGSVELVTSDCRPGRRAQEMRHRTRQRRRFFRLRAARLGRESAVCGGVRERRQGLQRAQYHRDEVQPRVDEQDVHRRRRDEAGGAGETLL